MTAFSLAFDKACRDTRFCEVAPTLFRGGSGSPVSSLFFLGRPLTVFFAVVTVVVYTVKAFSDRALSHVLKKIRERSPASAAGYPPPTIPMIVRSVGVIASLTHRVPRFVRRSSNASTVGGSVFRNSINMSATAGGCFAVENGIGIGSVLFSARTDALKTEAVTDTVMRLKSSNNCESSI